MIFVGMIVLVFGLLSAESIVPMIVGFLSTVGLTQWLKGRTGAVGIGAMAMAIAVSFLIGAVALIVASLLGNAPVEWSTLPEAALQLFALATIAYKLLTSEQLKNSDG